jgi:recombination protein RecT
MSQPTERPQIVTLLSSEKVRNDMALVIPPGVDVNALMARAKAAVLSSPKLLECDPQSILLAVKKSIGCGLELNGRDCHLVPFSEKAGNGWVKKAQFIIDAKGYIALGLRCGMKLITSELVCERDTFRRWTDDGGRHLLHEPNDREPRGKVIGAFSYTVNAKDTVDFEYMTLAEIDAIKARSAGAKYGTGPWSTDENEMRRKTVIRRHSKRWDIDTRFKRALEDDDDKLAELPEVKRAALILPGDPETSAALPDPAVTPALPEPAVEAPDDYDEWEKAGSK